MTYVCGSCGQVHDELSPYFMWRVPEIDDELVSDLEFDDDFTCRINNRIHFISCEVEIPFPDPQQTPLGFICWIEVSGADYQRYLAYRRDENLMPSYTEWVEGRLANPIPMVDGSLGTKVKFEVIEGDPTPYIKWVEPSSTLAERIEKQASLEFWHQAYDFFSNGGN